MITLFYAGWLVLLVVTLSVKVIRLRRQHQVAIGDDGHKDLQLAIRAHGNALEYLPLALLMLFMLEQANLAFWLIHGLGGVLLIGRLIHAYAIPSRNLKLRVLGMAMTFAMLLAGAGMGIGLAIGRW